MSNLTKTVKWAPLPTRHGNCVVRPLECEGSTPNSSELSFEIQNNSILTKSSATDQRISINVYVPSLEHAFTLCIPKDATILNVKQQLQQHLPNIPVSDQIIKLEGMELVDSLVVKQTALALMNVATAAGTPPKNDASISDAFLFVLHQKQLQPIYPQQPISSKNPYESKPNSIYKKIVKPPVHSNVAAKSELGSDKEKKLISFSIFKKNQNSRQMEAYLMPKEKTAEEMAEALHYNNPTETSYQVPEEVQKEKQPVQPETSSALLQLPEEWSRTTHKPVSEKSKIASNCVVFPSDERKPEKAQISSSLRCHYMKLLEYLPESYYQVRMLFWHATLNGYNLKAVVDTCLPITLLSKDTVEKTFTSNCVDRNFSGESIGAGPTVIVGRIHMKEIIAYDANEKAVPLPCTFTVADFKGIDIVLGLDMLIKHEAQVDLKRAVLQIGSSAIPLFADSALKVALHPELNVITTNQRSKQYRSECKILHPAKNGTNILQ